ncbi:hypothetical protein NIES2119_29885 [[Phormidium ambiguum] IAM M-71]|uniref:Uncharacterized protein n=1 Tax=[Phormidium ambiguum] IAM M-71 TaxID=454136 RepID=A0A1U7I3Z6_9CYAN|nr:tetratricopeptide repeat protein [Phormidium ambiguum]OKH30885.1 hypothetical protein NIES2119_29885 [Phormidium ambiguum IAM M-71]
MTKLANSGFEYQQNQEIINITSFTEPVIVKIGIEASAIKSIKPQWKRTHYRAIINWLTKYEPQPNAPNLEKIRGYLEAFHHLCEVEDWEKAWIILTLHLTSQNLIKLYEQLAIWSYYQYEVDLYSKILGKLDSKREAILLNNLGNAYRFQGSYIVAIEYHEQALAIAQSIGEKHQIGRALAGLANAYCCRAEYFCGIDYYKQGLENLQDIEDKTAKGAVLGNIGFAYSCIGDYPTAFDYLQQSLTVARTIGDIGGVGTALASLSSIYNDLKDYDNAINCSQEYLIIAQTRGDKWGISKALANFGDAFFHQTNYHKAIDYYQQSLVIVQEIGDKQGVGTILGSLGNAYKALENYLYAIDYYQQALVISAEIEDRRGEATAWFNLGYTLATVDRKWEAVKAFEKAHNLYQAIGLKDKVEKCDSFIQQVGMIVVAIPMKTPEITVTPCLRKYSQSVSRRNRLKAVLVRFGQKLIHWVRCLSRQLWQLFRVK